MFAGLLLLATLLLGACAKDIPVHIAPAERPVAPVDQPWVQGHFLTLAYHDVEDEDPDQGFLSVRTDRLVDQLNWLRENGYQAVSVDQILAARQPGGKPLPERAVLLTFDDGYRSFLTRAAHPRPTAGRRCWRRWARGWTRRPTGRSISAATCSRATAS